MGLGGSHPREALLPCHAPPACCSPAMSACHACGGSGRPGRRRRRALPQQARTLRGQGRHRAWSAQRATARQCAKWQAKLQGRRTIAINWHCRTFRIPPPPHPTPHPQPPSTHWWRWTGRRVRRPAAAAGHPPAPGRCLALCRRRPGPPGWSPARPGRPQGRCPPPLHARVGGGEQPAVVEILCRQLPPCTGGVPP